MSSPARMSSTPSSPNVSDSNRGSIKPFQIEHAGPVGRAKGKHQTDGRPKQRRARQSHVGGRRGSHRGCTGRLLQRRRARRSAGGQGSRSIAIEKANTANALSLPKFAFSTANLYSGAQPGGFFLAFSTPIRSNTETMYAGDPSAYGTPNDPHGRPESEWCRDLRRRTLRSYDGNTIVSARLACPAIYLSPGDHNIAWKESAKHWAWTRYPTALPRWGNDAIIYDIGMFSGKSGSEAMDIPESGLKGSLRSPKMIGAKC